jgi:hypothetical protein
MIQLQSLGKRCESDVNGTSRRYVGFGYVGQLRAVIHGAHPGSDQSFWASSRPMLAQGFPFRWRLVGQQQLKKTCTPLALK